jgi:DNA-binding beta-propeller fold protein YncE
MECLESDFPTGEKTMHASTRLTLNGVALTLLSSLFLASPVARADSLYVANISNSSVEQYNSSGTKTVFNNSNLNQPVGLAFDSSGNLYVANYGGNYIQELSPTGAPLATINLPAGSGPTGLVFDSTGKLYVAENTANRIDIITAGVVSTYIDQNHDGYLNQPVGLAFDSNGILYVADSGANHVERITSSLAPSIFADDSSANDPLDGPFGLAFDPAGNLFVTSAINNSIEKITTGGVMSVFANASANLDVPTGIAFNSAGDLFVANAGQNNSNTILEFAAGSSSSTTFATVNDTFQRRLIAFGPDATTVPLPSSAYASLPLLTLLTLSQLRRRSQAGKA